MIAQQRGIFIARRHVMGTNFDGKALRRHRLGADLRAKACLAAPQLEAESSSKAA